MKKRGNIVTFLLIVAIFATLISMTVTPIAKKINLGLDLQGGFEILYEVEPIDQSQEVNRTLLEATVQRLNDRVNKLGISETVIDIEGEDRIRVQLAGVEDQAEAREILSTSARLSFRDVFDEEHLDGTDVKEGSAKQDFHPDTNQPMVTLQLKSANKFGDVTSEIANMAPNNFLVIWMDFEEGDSFEAEASKEDPKFISSASVRKPIYSSGVQIEGNFTVEEAKRLADIINAGSLPVHMEELYSTSVGAQFGEKALNQTVFAGIIGISIIFIFMAIVYRFPGIVAGINIPIYIFMILLIFQLMNGVLTLPGIAALILGVGMAVDANVLTFERIKEELRSGKSVVSSFKAGTRNSLITILDANITTLLAAAVLFIFGTSSIKGFATMLIVSIVVSFLTAVFGTRLLLSFWVQSGFLRNRKYLFGVKKDQIQHIATKEEVEPTIFNRTVDVVKHRKKIFTTTLIVVIIGVISLSFLQINPGIDFSSGSRIEILAEEQLETKEVERHLDELQLEAKSIVISGEESEIAVMRFDSVLDEATIDQIKQYFIDLYGDRKSVV